MKKLLLVGIMMAAVSLCTTAQPADLKPVAQKVNPGHLANFKLTAKAHAGFSCRVLASVTPGKTHVMGDVWLPFAVDSVTWASVQYANTYWFRHFYEILPIQRESGVMYPSIQIPNDSRLSGLAVYVSALVFGEKRMWTSNRSLVVVR